MANNNLKIREGTCPNFGNCNKANAKEIIKVNVGIGEEFICPECDCGSPLVEKVSPPPPWRKIAIVAVVIALLGGLGFGISKLFLSGKKTAPITETFPTVEMVEPVQTAVEPEPVEIEPTKPTTPTTKTTTTTTTGTTTSGNGTKPYSFGKYEGRLVNGIPDGQGTMYYTCRVQIAKHGRNTYYAEKGDTFVGTWGNGDVVNGNLFDSSNNQKAAILAGKRPNPYDLKNDKCE